MFNANDVRFDESNPEPRCPCVLLLDVSSSMTGEPIAALNEGLQLFEQEIRADELASRRVELAVVSFGGVVQVEQDFVEAKDFRAPHLEAMGDTPMGAGINQGLDLLEERKDLYRQTGISYFRPWAFLITDGYPTDAYEGAAQRVGRMEEGKKVAFFAVGVEGADMDLLERIAVRQPLKLRGLCFAEMFQWLSDSLQAGSVGQPGSDVPLNQSPLGWGTISS